MASNDEPKSRKRERDHDEYHREAKAKKPLRYKVEASDRKSKKHKRKHDDKSHLRIMDDDDGDDVWIEKNVDGEVIAQDIPTAESLKLTSRAYTIGTDPPLPPSVTSESRVQRDEWMISPDMDADELPLDGANSATGASGGSGNAMKKKGDDFFTSLGIEKKKKETAERPNPDKLVLSSRELNPQFKEGKPIDEYVAPKSRQPTPGGPGFQWRMMRLRRVYETADEDNRPVEEVAVEKFGSLEAFEELKEEKRILDEREGKRAARRKEEEASRYSDQKGGERGYMFSDIGSPGLGGRSASFRKPGAQGDSRPSTPGARPGALPTNKRVDSLRLPSEASSPATASSVLTPIPTVMTPPAIGTSQGVQSLSTTELNKLQARVLKAKLMGNPDAERLEQEYEAELARSRGLSASDNEGKKEVRVEVLPTIDAKGQLYDVGKGRDDAEPTRPGNRKKKERVETRDPKTGEIVRYNADDDSTTLGDMLREERFGAGMSDQKNMDAQLAKAIMSDGKFEADLEYMDDNAEKLGRKKMRSDAMKRQFAINDYARTKRVLDTCPYCYGEDDSPPKVPVIAMATRCYLSCTSHEELVDGHCHIIPIQHHLCTLEGDDDLWDEIRNFMKCLMKMFADQDQGVIFYETVLKLKWQKHTYIECVPVPWDLFEQLPAYFKESILMSETEWSQHKKLIDFSKRPGGFRRAMVPNLPYFMVQWDYKGEKGFGHVIEGTGEAVDEGDPEAAFDEGAKGGGEFPRYFAAEIIGNQLDVEPRRWRRPRRLDFRTNKERVAAFLVKYKKYDWTGMIPRS